MIYMQTDGQGPKGCRGPPAAPRDTGGPGRVPWGGIHSKL